MLHEKTVRCAYPYIDGRNWVSDGQIQQNVVNPYSGNTIAKVCLATSADIEVAIERAFESQKKWAALLAKEREAVLSRAADIVERRRDEIARILIEEGGNVVGKAMFGATT